MIHIENLCFYRHDGTQKTSILNELNFSLESGSQVALVGDSGSGKTTLLHLMAGLLKPASGKIIINNDNISHYDDSQLADYRKQIGLVFQHYQLLSALTVEDNILFQLKLNQPNLSTIEIKTRLDDITNQLGINHKLKSLPNQLSGGEQQRVGIARALIHQPSVVFADEPTGNLDQQRSSEVVELLTQLCSEKQINLVMVTHSQTLAHRFSHLYTLANGKLHDRT